MRQGAVLAAALYVSKQGSLTSLDKWGVEQAHLAFRAASIPRVIGSIMIMPGKSQFNSVVGFL